MYKKRKPLSSAVASANLLESHSATAALRRPDAGTRSSALAAGAAFSSRTMAFHSFFGGKTASADETGENDPNYKFYRNQHPAPDCDFCEEMHKKWDGQWQLLA